MLVGVGEMLLLAPEPEGMESIQSGSTGAEARQQKLPQRGGAGQGQGDAPESESPSGAAGVVAALPRLLVPAGPVALLLLLRAGMS